MKKIYFYSPPPYSDDFATISSVPLHLNSYIKNHCPELLDQFEWTMVRSFSMNYDVLVNELNDLDIDILAVSVYIWNETEIYSNIKTIKSDVKKPIKIIAGGPSVIPNVDKTYFEDHPEVDYAIFGQGEKAFCSVLKNIIYNQSLNELNTTNLAWQQNGKVRISGGEFLRLENETPLYTSQDLLKKMVDQCNSYKREGLGLRIPWGTSKGCMYKCSFCAWGQGSTKVYHRKGGLREELELMAKLGFSVIDITDANFGQHKQDIEVVEHIIDLNKKHGYNLKIGDISFSKLRWEENLKIVELGEAHNIWTLVTIALQDTNREILKNIDRPSIDWEEWKPRLRSLRQKFPKIKFRTELIRGLPGQTRDSWEQSLIDLDDIPVLWGLYEWIQLPNSPSFDPEYIDKMKLRIETLYFIHRPFPTIVESYSYNFEDWLYFWLLGEFMHIDSLAKLPNRRELFDDVKNSRHLSETLQEMKDQVYDVDFDFKIKKITAKFIHMLLKEYPKYLEKIGNSIYKELFLHCKAPKFGSQG